MGDKSVWDEEEEVEELRVRKEEMGERERGRERGKQREGEGN